MSIKSEFFAGTNPSPRRDDRRGGHQTQVEEGGEGKVATEIRQDKVLHPLTILLHPVPL